MRYYSTQRPFGPGTFPRQGGTETITNFDDPEKKAQFIDDWQDGRSSLNDISGEAHKLAARLKERRAERDG